MSNGSGQVRDPGQAGAPVRQDAAAQKADAAGQVGAAGRKADTAGQDRSGQKANVAAQKVDAVGQVNSAGQVNALGQRDVHARNAEPASQVEAPGKEEAPGQRVALSRAATAEKKPDGPVPQGRAAGGSGDIPARADAGSSTRPAGGEGEDPAEHAALIDSIERGLRGAREKRDEGLAASGEADVVGADLTGQSGGQVTKETVGAMVSTLRRMLSYASAYRIILIIAVGLAAAGAVLEVVIPNYLGRITDLIQEGLAGTVDVARVGGLAWVIVALIAGAFTFRLAQNRIMVVVTQRTAQRMRSQINGKIDRMPLSYFDRHRHGDTLSRMTNDVDTLAETLNNSVSSVMTGAITMLGSAVMMFVTEWRMALAGIGAALLGMVLSAVIMSISQKYFTRQQQQLGALNGHIEEVYSGHMVVRAYNAQEQVRREFHERNEALFSNAWKAQFLSGLMWPLMMFVGNLGYVVVCVVGSVLVLGGHIQMGTIVAFMVYIRLFTEPLGEVAEAATSFQSAAAAGTRVFELLDEEEMPDESGKPERTGEVRGEVEFDSVRFGYDEGEEIIHGFSASVLPGQKVAIVGPTGAGKTTMVNLLMRFYELWGGQIRIDGVSISDMRREDVDSLFSMVLQDTWLFEGTLRENIVYHTEDVSSRRLDEVIERTGLAELVARLPAGYETVIKEESLLSAGQRQLVTIARAMIADRPLLILDEATSSIDTRTEQVIQQALDELTRGRTSFIIAHRLSTIRDADIIFVMADGDVVETGTHDELLERGGLYAELYESQFDEPGEEGEPS